MACRSASRNRWHRPQVAHYLIGDAETSPQRPSNATYKLTERGLLRTDTIRSWMRGDGALLPRQGGKLWLLLTPELWPHAHALD